MADEDQQSASIKWNQELLGSFPAIMSKTEQGLQVIKDVTDFYRNRAKIEDEYAKKLKDLYKNHPGAGFFIKEPAIAKEHKTLKEAVLAVLDKGTKISDSHQEFANNISNNICKNLDNWVKTKTNDRMKIINEGQKVLKIISDSKANVSKCRTEYERLMKETDSSKEALIKAEKDEQAQPENKKLQPITKKAAEKYSVSRQKAKTAEIAYQAAVKKANEDIETSKKEKLPTVIDSLQKWEEERWNSLLGSVRTFKNLQEAVPSTLDQQIKELETVYDAANIEQDFKEFTEANKKLDSEETIEFVAFKSKYEEEEEKKEEPVQVTQSSQKEESVQSIEQVQPNPEDEEKKEADRLKAEQLKKSLFGSDGGNTTEDMFT